MKIILYPAILALGVAQPGVAASPEQIAQSWKERGFVALSRLDSLKDKQDRKSRYQLLLEFAFAMHATTGQSNRYGFVRKTDNGLDFYKIILNKGTNPVSKTVVDEAGLFAINYIYDQKTGDFGGVKIELLPKGWNVLINPALPNALLLDVSDSNIVIVFDVTNPMNVVVGSFP
jgi:hypothetical protein